jgi:transposase
MRKTYKYRIYLTNGQRRLLERQLAECRWVWNQLLEARKFAYEQSIKCGLYDLQALLVGWKKPGHRSSWSTARYCRILPSASILRFKPSFAA